MATSLLETLPRIIITSSILPYITSSEWLKIRVASQSCHDILHEGEEAESLWRAALVRDYLFVEGTTDGDRRDVLHQSIRCRAENEDGAAFLSTEDVFTASTSFISWKHWRKIDLRLHCHGRSIETLRSWETLVGPYFLRAAAMWENIEHWCDDITRSGAVGGAMKSSLLPGRPLDPSAQYALGDGPTSLSAFQAVYAFYAGQHNTLEGDIHHHTGLFGGIQAYNFITSTRWCAPDFQDHDIASSIILARGEGKDFMMETNSGQVYLISKHHDKVATPIVSGPRRVCHSSDSILRWFEEHSRRLHRNFYSVGLLKSDGGFEYNSLLRYPAISDTDNCSRAVSRGVEVVASAVLCLEIQMFVYSIRMRLLGPEDGEGYMTPEERGFATCQLVSRHWRISKSSPNSDELVVDRVHGEGVIGYYPLLREGGYESHYGNEPDSIQIEGQGVGYYSYQSCTEPVPGSFEGHLQFVPGTLAEPSGEMFNVRVNPFPLQLPDFLY